MEDLERGEDAGKKCRICHLSLLEVGGGAGDGHGGAKYQEEEGGTAMELGCKCKNDLAFVHQHCAEAWFKIKGNNVCEICGSTATNMVAISEETEVIANASVATDSTSAPGPDPVPATPDDARPFWAGHKVLNFLLACMVFAFIVSWVFHFSLPN
ncbi:hypothetical protein EJ110_NYTH27922 [Nymphaea thermarum]|nr:hypothetical protein EJ110_NYTH27922 [Nymphaea thermarum]